MTWTPELIFQGLKILYGVIKAIQSLDRAVRYASKNPQLEPDEIPEGCGDDAHWQELLAWAKKKKAERNDE